MPEPVRTGDWMLTYSGIQFWPLDPRPEEMFIEDIAHALSLQCRFAGHCLFHYSVAQHSVLVAQHATPENALWGLLHDAAEAYLVDLPRPIKRYSTVGTEYKKVESLLEIAIAQRFGLSLPVPDEIKLLDNRALKTEKRDVMPGSDKPWIETEEPFEESIQPMWSSEAERQFMHMFLQFGGGYASA